jgi:hypothetical protein
MKKPAKKMMRGGKAKPAKKMMRGGKAMKRGGSSKNK